MKSKYILAGLLSALVATSAAAKSPRLVINIVSASMRASDIARYDHNFNAGGLAMLFGEGAVFSQCYCDFMQTTTPTALATLATGAMPSTHGVVGLRWRDYVENDEVSLLGGDAANPSPRELIAPTLTEALAAERPSAQCVTIAIDAPSAIITAGSGGNVFWIDRRSGMWTSAQAYGQLPEWVVKYNNDDMNRTLADWQWSRLLPDTKYRNTREEDIVSASNRRPRRSTRSYGNTYARLAVSPAGNKAMFAFAQSAVTRMRLGQDDTPDLLNICLDTPETICEKYGPESVEYEDMIYRLDADIAEFLSFVTAQTGNSDDVLVVFTAAHGSSPESDDRHRFNPRQFEVIMNAFLSAKYGSGDWVVEYANRSLYLNHNLAYERGLTLAEVQNEAATFAMQFRGVSHALSSTAMRMSYFGSGYARKMQNGFYPRRSGDVVINLMPGWIEEREGCRSSAGSMYGYDTHVPLVFFGAGIDARTFDERIDTSAAAATLAHILDIAEPAASEGTALTLQTKE